VGCVAHQVVADTAAHKEGFEACFLQLGKGGFS
jgi:hypothetical protein